MQEIQTNLNELWGSVIQSYHFDILSNKITFKLETINNGISKFYKLECNQVSLWYFINNVSDSRKVIYSPEEGDYLELTSINTISDGIIQVKSLQDDWIEQYHGKINLSIEVWSKLLMVEAKSISINDDIYILGY